MRRNAHIIGCGVWENAICTCGGSICKCCREDGVQGVHSCFSGHDCKNAPCEWCDHPLKEHLGR